MSKFAQVEEGLRHEPKHWLVTGAAGFIGSHLVEYLLSIGQTVTGMDDFSTGRESNLAMVQSSAGSGWERFTLQRADIRDADSCARACAQTDYVLHQAAIGSVPRSIEDPRTSHSANVDGFFNIVEAARAAGSRSVVYASSSSVYGDHPTLPKGEAEVGTPLSPYAATKRANEIYAAAWSRAFDLRIHGLRYFNVVGPRQDPSGAYAAVVPRWIAAFSELEQPEIFGDGETSRDFCPVPNVVQANVLAATNTELSVHQVFNVALGQTTTLNELYGILRAELERLGKACGSIEPRYRDFRPGDIRHSLADIRLARERLGYEPTTTLAEGLRAACESFLATNE